MRSSRLIPLDAQALKGVWVNIHDFLDAENKPNDVVFFKSERALAAYTLNTRKLFPRRKISQGSPLRDLLAHILRRQKLRKDMRWDLAEGMGGWNESVLFPSMSEHCHREQG